MLKDIKVAAIQAKVPRSQEEGEEQVTRLVEEACSEPVDLVGLPEDCITSLRDTENGYDPFPFLANLAKKHSIYLFGANTKKESQGMHNIGFVFDKNGELISQHNKIVLTPLEESDGIIPGNSLEIFETEFGKMSLLICKDAFHRYAAWFFEELRKADVDIILIPSYSLTVTKRSIGFWVDSLKALTNWFDVYIVAPGTVGPNLTEYPSFGHSLILSPLHGIVAEGSFDKEEILRSTLDVASLEKIRNSSGAKWQPKEPPQVKLVKK